MPLPSRHDRLRPHLELRLSHEELTALEIKRCIQRLKERIGEEWAQPYIDVHLRLDGAELTAREYALVEGCATLVDFQSKTYGHSDGCRNIQPDYDGSVPGHPVHDWNKLVPPVLADEFTRRTKSRRSRRHEGAYDRLIGYLKLLPCRMMYCVTDVKGEVRHYIAPGAIKADPNLPLPYGWNSFEINDINHPVIKRVLRKEKFETVGPFTWFLLSWDETYEIILKTLSPEKALFWMNEVAGFEKRDLRSLEMVTHDEPTRAFVHSVDGDAYVFSLGEEGRVEMHGGPRDYGKLTARHTKADTHPRHGPIYAYAREEHQAWFNETAAQMLDHLFKGPRRDPNERQLIDNLVETTMNFGRPRAGD